VVDGKTEDNSHANLGDWCPIPEKEKPRKLIDESEKPRSYLSLKQRNEINPIKTSMSSTYVHFLKIKRKNINKFA